MRPLTLRQTALLAVSICLLAGCGGGQTGGSSRPATNSQSGTIGEATFTYSGKPQQMITQSAGNVSASAIAGATFSTIQVNPAPILANTYLVYSRYLNETGQIFKANYGAWQETEVTSDSDGAFGPAVSKNGVVYYSENSFGTYIGQCLSDGTHFKIDTASTSGSYYYADPSPNALAVAYDWGGGHLCYCGPNGGTAKTVQTNDTDYGNSWFPNGTSLAYVAQNGTYRNIYTTTITGGTATNITPYTLAGSGNWSNPTCSPDGVSVAAIYTPSGSSNGELVVFNTSGDGNYILLTPSGDSDSYPSFSPDGNWIAFYRSNAGGATPGIYITNYSGAEQSLVVGNTATAGYVTGLNWSPFPASLTLVGSTQFYSSAASGFLYTQVNSIFGSLLAFTANTPSTANVTAASASGYQPLIFTLGADAIKRIGYINYYFDSGNFITPPASTPSAVVSVDAVTGYVDTVVTAASPAKQLATRTVGSSVTYSGKFTGIYDKTGKNLAPSGASQIVLNAKSGHLVSYQ